MDSKLVSICIPTYNSEKYLEKTLQTIISQTYDNLEIIIGDNGSSDSTLDLIRKYSKIDDRISFYTNEINIGYSKNCNKLISQCSGEYISIFHSDDLYDMTIVEKQVDALNKNSDLLGVFTSFFKINEYDHYIMNVVYPFNSKNKLLKVNLDIYIKFVLLKGASCFCCPTSMIRSDVYKQLKGYDENLKHIEDQDMWARILLNGSLGIINQKLIKYRIHDAQVSSIYMNREIDKYSLPLIHILDFLIKNSLYGNYSTLVDKSKASESILFAKIAAINNDFCLFKTKLKESRNIYKFSLFSKSGLIQQSPFLKLLFILTRFINK
jgi:glycosyltransferase involved in cell wall biosynthesis